MKPGQRLTLWWQRYVAGGLRTPRDLVSASRREIPAPPERVFSSVVPAQGPRFDAPERLIADRHFHTEAWLRQGEAADWAQVDRRAMRWSAIFVELARRRGIPLYVPWATSESLAVVHALHGASLSKQEWKFLHVLGDQAFRKLEVPQSKPKGLPWVFHVWPAPGDPAVWRYDCWERQPFAPSGPVRMMPRAILRAVKL